MLKYCGVEFRIQGLDNAAFRRLNHVLHFHGVHDGDLLPLKDFVTLSHKPFNDSALKWRPDGDGARWDVIDRRRDLLCCATLTMTKDGKRIIRINPSPGDRGISRCCGGLSGFSFAECLGNVFQPTVCLLYTSPSPRD